MNEKEEEGRLKSLFPNVLFGKNVHIGEGVSLIGNIIIGDNVVIQSGAVIGEQGFMLEGDRPLKIVNPGVIIDANVEIGANTCIDRGVDRATRIRKGVKLANLCHIAHDVEIGEGTRIAAKTSVSGHVRIGNNCRIGAGVTIKDHLVIDNDVFIGIGSVVMRSIEESHVVLGYPAVQFGKKKEILKISGIAKQYKNSDEQTLQNVSFSIGECEFVSLLGPSGCGKTTLLKILAGLLEADKGEIISENGEEIRIGMVFQEDSLFPWYTVEKNIELGLKIKKKERKEIREKTDWVLKVVGLEKNRNYYPKQLSGGMKKRVAIARCLVLDSNLVLMDEPFSALDEITKRNIQEDFREMQQKEKFSVCMVTHDIEEAIALSDRILIVGGHPADVRHVIPNLLPDRSSRESDEFLQMKKTIIGLVNDMKDEL